MEPEHASGEKMFYGNYFIFSRKNMNTNGFQKIKIWKSQDLEKRPKTCPGWPKQQANFFAIFVKRAIKPLGKIFRAQGKIRQNTNL